AQAERAAATIAAAADPRTGMIPAIVSEKCASVIIPAIEGLVFPWALGMREVFRPGGKFAPFIAALRRHCQAVLRKGVCLYPDGGWKLSSSADNSWLSKIYLCQFIAREVLGVRGPEAGEAADRAHMAWLLRPENAYYAFSDQMTSGVAMASKYYPRGVTAILWLDEAAGGRRRGK
ncbi:MAG: beta-xylosidase, partial [Planctomycetes bacterium]|nr:beta-xylosidase [Planctomycetota bacterium]